MPKVLPAIFSYEDMKSRFAQDNPDDPYTRRKDLESGIYALDSWLIRVDDDNKAISTVGFKEHPSHTVVGGMYASAKGREIGGNNRALQIAREPQLNQSKPLVAAFGHRDGDNARWIAKAKQNGWKFPEDNDFQQVSQMLPEQVVNAWNSAYPNGNWAIRSIRGEGDFAKCVFIDDPMPAWFNVIKYLPDNTWDDFELGEPVPDLGTRDRFKDKNIKSKGKAEYKAFITQQYLRQVSDRIPNAGTSLMKGWLEKLTELDLDKGKYWYFGTNVKEDRTYVMIDVIEKGQPYTRTAGKKFNLEGMDKGIVFIGVSKEMVGKIKRGQGIPKGRKFIDLHGKYGVRGLRGQRRLPKQPTNPFPKPQDIEKMTLLKWLPSTEFEILLDDDGKRVVFKEKKRNRSKYDDRIFYHSPTNTWIRPHYFDKGAKRTKHQPYANDRTQINTWLEKLSQESFSGRAWFYVNDNPMDLSYVEVVNIPVGGKLPESINKVTNKKPVEGTMFNSFRGSRSELDAYLGHIGEDKLLDFWGTGIKEGHKEGADMHNSVPKTPDDVRAKEKHERVSSRLSKLLPFTTLSSNKSALGHYTSVLQIENRLQELKDIPSIIEKDIITRKKNKREKRRIFLEKELPNEKEQLENFLERRDKLIAEQRRLSGMFKKSWFDILRA